LKALIDTYSQHVSSLKSMDLEINGVAEYLVVYLMTSRLDGETRKYWESFVKKDEMPKFNEIIDKLTDRIRILESIEIASKMKQIDISKPTATPKRSAVKSYFSADSTNKCQICNGSSHNLYYCAEFRKMKISEMMAKLKALKLCFVCFKPGHAAQTCAAPFKCEKCKNPHNKLLHFDRKEDEKKNEEKKSDDKKKENSNVFNCWSESAESPKEVLLCTAVALVEDSDGNLKLARILLDSGSQSNFITEKFANKLKLKKMPLDVIVKGIDSSASTVKSGVDIKLKARDGNFEVNLNCLVIRKITGKVPSKVLDRQGLKLNDSTLADPRFNIPADVDILLGAQHFLKFMKNDRKVLSDEIMLQNTVFGFVVAGSIQSTTSLSINLHTVKEDHQLDLLNKTLQKFWEVESVTQASTMSPEERYCEEHFEKTYKRDDTGRFVVTLPLKENVNALGESKQKALKMLNSLERKLESDVELKKYYHEFMLEYENLGHMEKVKESGFPTTVFYMPHHCVLKPSSTTTKVRVVFNASAETSSGLSLNDVLMAGPKIQQNLVQILMRFRKHRYAIVGDIEKMYRQILIDKSQRNLQRILCRLSGNGTTEFVLNTVTYGTVPGSYEATKCLWKIAELNRQSHENAATRIQRDFYMDDLLTGTNSINDAVKLRKEIVNILSSAGFNLRKWASNSPLVLEGLSQCECEMSQKIDLEDDTSLKTLGIAWNPTADIFLLTVKPFENTQPITKRNLLADIARFYDPLGFVEPVIVTFKIFMQSLWKLKVDWDEELPSDCADYWRKYRTELCEINKLKIDRKIIPDVMDPDGLEYELIGFADASESAFGACIYIRTKISENEYVTKLLTSKTRVAPIKTISLPRLELCAALLLSQLVEVVAKTMEINFKQIVLFTDSEIVLCWIQKPPSTLTTFVANRVSEIQRITQNILWRHVESKMNPADIISRGIPAANLIENTLWWNGPNFLRKNESTWPINKFNEKIIDVPEIKKITLQTMTVTNCEEIDEILLKYEKYERLLMVVGWIRRFLNNCLCRIRKKVPESSEFLTSDEIVASEYSIIKCLQRMNFADDLKNLTLNRNVCKSSQLKFLNPFIEEETGLIRVGGRIKHSKLPYHVRNPIVLSAKHPLVKLIVRNLHQKNGHAAQQTLLAISRQKFWIVGAKNLIRKICHECVLCFKVKPRQSDQFMGDLPASRLNEVYPFFECGVDYAGPLEVKVGGPRSNKKSKAYIALFVCFVTKAVHLELVSDATAECFIAALRRFVAEKGYPAQMYSDNGGNFVKANTDLIALKNLFENQQFKEGLNSFCRQRGINWHFNPPRAPHMGAIWESHVKITKFHLVRMSAHLLLNFEQLSTLLKEIQGLVNSRPITAISNDPNDLIALTPAHFLIGRETVSIPEPSYIETKLNRLKIWEKIQQVKQKFWERFHEEYITSLQQRLKWYGEKVKIEIDSLALLKDDNTPPLQWKLGRIVKLYPGKDGIVRVVDLKTMTGIFKRSVHNICILPQPDDDRDCVESPAFQGAQ
jgi:hypothetical protein